MTCYLGCGALGMTESVHQGSGLKQQDLPLFSLTLKGKEMGRGHVELGLATALFRDGSVPCTKDAMEVESHRLGHSVFRR